MVAHGTNRGEWNSDPFSADEWVSEYFILRGGHWRCALSSLTPDNTNPVPEP